ncbi:unnamed protein product, partial [Pylaiella littoralis]
MWIGAGCWWNLGQQLSAVWDDVSSYTEAVRIRPSTCTAVLLYNSTHAWALLLRSRNSVTKGCLYGEDAGACPVTDGGPEEGCWSLYRDDDGGGKDVGLPCVWIRCWVSIKCSPPRTAIVKPHFLLVVHRIPKWVRSLCSTLLGPAFSSDYAGDGPTSPLPQSHLDAQAQRSAGHGGGSNTVVGVTPEGERGAGLEADQVARQSRSSAQEMGVDESNSSLSGGQGVV